MRWALIAMLGAGCYRPGPDPTCTSDDCVDAATPDDTSPTRVCLGDPSGLMPDTCFDPVPDAIMIGAAIDTNVGAPCNVPVADNPDLCIIAASQITFAPGTFTARGSRPLVLWAATAIVLPAGTTLSLTSQGANFGAGANDALCPELAGSENIDLSPNLGSGGCGGPFGGAGGIGGAASNLTLASVSTTCAPALQALDRVRGGCRGGKGGLSQNAGTPNGGSSAGAVYMMAGEKIEVHGKIDARGNGGGLAIANDSTMAGGGGGGSGGLIAFETPSLNLDGATLNALGGGGSSGSGKDAVADLILQGNGGRSPTFDPPDFAGGANPTVVDNLGGAGGFDGSFGGGVMNDQIGGGGGGGGAVGYIRLFVAPSASTTDAKIRPPLITP